MGFHFYFSVKDRICGSKAGTIQINEPINEPQEPSLVCQERGCLGGRVGSRALPGKSLGSSCSLNTTKVQRTENHVPALLKGAFKFLLNM